MVWSNGYSTFKTLNSEIVELFKTQTPRKTYPVQLGKSKECFPHPQGIHSLSLPLTATAKVVSNAEDNSQHLSVK